jgi:hypothetical protein
VLDGRDAVARDKLSGMKSQPDMKKPSRARRLFLGLVGTAGTLVMLGLAACATQVASRDPEERRDTERSGGPVQMALDTALDHGELSVEQADGVQAIKDRLAEGKEDKRAVRRELRTTAGEIVRGGGSDPQALEDALAQATLAIEKRVERGSTALKDLHALLDPDQRVLVADAIRARIEEKKSERRERDRKDRFKQVAAHLTLDAEQMNVITKLRDELFGAKKQIKPTDEEIEALITAFEGEGFAAALDAFNEEKLALVRERLDDAAGRVDGVLSILADDQRALLADLIERGPEAVGLSRR